MISAPPSLAVGWLGTRLRDLSSTLGGLEIALRAEEDPVAFEAEGIDARFCYGRNHYPELTVEELCVDGVTPLCSPAFRNSHGPIDDPGALLGLPLIHTDWGSAAANFPTWRDWFARQGGGN